METTFITIHNLSEDANILYASKSITDILGYSPEEVVGRSCFEYFHPDEVPFARTIHRRGIHLDKAAVLHYAQIRGRDGEWIGCECVFTIVYQVMVACTSIYKETAKSAKRAVDAPNVRNMFASSPNDPRYHMLEHLSSKFRAPPPQAPDFEPRAALILNRFSHSLTVLYATNAVTDILGVTPEELNGMSFYDCMQEDCYPDAEQCLRSAKENDSIAYLRFWYHDPRQEDDIDDEQMRDASASSDSDEDGGVPLNTHMSVEAEDNVKIKEEDTSSGQESHYFSEQEGTDHSGSRTSSGNSSRMAHDAARAMFDIPVSSRQGQSRSPSSASSLVSPRGQAVVAAEPREIEAVVSCTSDGLVVVLRRARPRISFLEQPVVAQVQNGLFVAPWGAPPIRPHVFVPNQHQPFEHGLHAPLVPPGGPPPDELLASIQEVAVFAWSLVGINGNIASYGRGIPRGEAQPARIPVWNPYAVPVPSYPGPENQAALRWARERSREPQSDMPVRHRRGRRFGRQRTSGDTRFRTHQPAAQLYRQPDNMQSGFNNNHNNHNNHNGPLGMLPLPSRSQAPESPLARPDVSMSQGPQTASAPASPGPSEGSGANRYLWY